MTMMENNRKATKPNRWKDVRRGLTPAREARVKARVQTELAKLPLAEVRKAQAMTQVRLAELLQVNQGAVSKMEQRSDMYLSTLRSYIEAMGGRLDIRAVFPSGEMVLERLGEAADAAAGSASNAKHRRMVGAAASGR